MSARNCTVSPFHQLRTRIPSWQGHQRIELGGQKALHILPGTSKQQYLVDLKEENPGPFSTTVQPERHTREEL